MTRVYLAGPMTGHPEHNYPAFHRDAADLRDAGYDVVNPAELDPTTHKPWHVYLRQDLAELLTCDRIAVLPGWADSNGARLEVHVARELGMRVLRLPPHPPHPATERANAED